MSFTKMSRFEMERIQAIWEDEGPVPIAIHRSFIVTTDEGATVRTLTNDNDDDGYPDGNWQSWELTYPSVEAALRHCGKCRVGISGVIVTVLLDGKEVRE